MQIKAYREQPPDKVDVGRVFHLFKNHANNSVDLMTHGNLSTRVYWRNSVVASVKGYQKVIFTYSGVWYHFEGLDFIKVTAQL